MIGNREGEQSPNKNKRKEGEVKGGIRGTQRGEREGRVSEEKDRETGVKERKTKRSRERSALAHSEQTSMKLNPGSFVHQYVFHDSRTVKCNTASLECV